MDPAIPFKFEPGSSKFAEHHLEYSKTKSGTLVNWPLGGVTLTIPKHVQYGGYPQLSEIENANGDLVKFYGRTGFTAGSYHEFFVGSLDVCFGFRMNTVEVSFGEATPLAAFLFDGYYQEKYFGLWSDIMSMRIFGGNRDEVEAIFINAAIRYNEKFGQIPAPIALDPSLIYDMPEPNFTSPTVIRQDPAIRDVDPLRFYYYGMTQSDNASACIYFYRILEYYSFLNYHSQIAQLRHDRNLSDVDFNKKILEVISRDDKSPFIRLISQITDQLLLEAAVTSGVVSSKDAGLLDLRIYEFRNSIVHGKQSFGYDMHSGSVVSESPNLVKWRNLLRGLAKKALDNYGARLI